jgi:hypothetical protein
MQAILTPGLGFFLSFFFSTVLDFNKIVDFYALIHIAPIVRVITITKFYNFEGQE